MTLLETFRKIRDAFRDGNYKQRLPLNGNTGANSSKLGTGKAIRTVDVAAAT